MNLTNPTSFLTLHKPSNLKVLQPTFCYFTVFIWYRLLLLTNSIPVFFSVCIKLYHVTYLIELSLGFFVRCVLKKKFFLVSLKLNYAKFEFRRLGIFLHISFIFWWCFYSATKVAQELWCFCHLTLDMKWISVNILIKNCSFQKTKFNEEKRKNIYSQETMTHRTSY